VNRARAHQAGANAATLANALLGLGAIAYTLAGNTLFALLLVVGAIGFDGLDGMLHRRGGGPPRPLGRILDSTADAISFGIAPGLLVAVHTYAATAFAPYASATLGAGVAVTALALARLVYFTLRSYRLPYFLGASTPQTAIALVVAVLLVDQPGYLGVSPGALLAATALVAPLMVLPIPFPKIRARSSLRGVMTFTSVALAVALVPAQFVPARGSPLYLIAEGATVAALIGIALYYVAGPRSARRDTTPPSEAADA
jgi:phosphatidylserine synthase